MQHTKVQSAHCTQTSMNNVPISSVEPKPIFSNIGNIGFCRQEKVAQEVSAKEFRYLKCRFQEASVSAFGSKGKKH